MRHCRVTELSWLELKFIEQHEAVYVSGNSWIPGRASFRQLARNDGPRMAVQMSGSADRFLYVALIPCFSLLTIYIQTTDKLRRRDL